MGAASAAESTQLPASEAPAAGCRVDTASCVGSRRRRLPSRHSVLRRLPSGHSFLRRKPPPPAAESTQLPVSEAAAAGCRVDTASFVGSRRSRLPSRHSLLRMQFPHHCRSIYSTKSVRDHNSPETDSGLHSTTTTRADTSGDAQADSGHH